MNRVMKWVLAVAIGGSGMGLTGCASHAGTGALIGGAAGAGLGAMIGHNAHHRTAEGALIGGAIGAIGGGLVGNEMDRDGRAHRDRYAYERGYEDGRYDSSGGYYQRDEFHYPPPHRAHRGRYVQSHRQTRIYRR